MRHIKKETKRQGQKIEKLSVKESDKKTEKEIEKETK